MLVCISLILLFVIWEPMCPVLPTTGGSAPATIHFLPLSRQSRSRGPGDELATPSSVGPSLFLASAASGRTRQLVNRQRSQYALETAAQSYRFPALPSTAAIGIATRGTAYCFSSDDRNKFGGSPYYCHHAPDSPGLCNPRTVRGSAVSEFNTGHGYFTSTQLSGTPDGVGSPARQHDTPIGCFVMCCYELEADWLKPMNIVSKTKIHRNDVTSYISIKITPIQVDGSRLFRIKTFWCLHGSLRSAYMASRYGGSYTGRVSMFIAEYLSRLVVALHELSGYWLSLKCWKNCVRGIQTAVFYPFVTELDSGGLGSVLASEICGYPASSSLKVYVAIGRQCPPLP
ncbi:hypothetical protein B0H11DRAFT_1919819 [Mycena galericulata]|nr:hypothetical protein B0H11DRAFT_1919819 [Mycena galericulata]